ncbi:MAG: antitoxin [Brevundimonas sp.]
MDDAWKPESADTAKLFTSGGSQAVRLPKAYRFEGSEVLIWRDGPRVILEPIPQRARSQAELDAMWARIRALDDPDDLFPDPREQTITDRPAL